MKIVKLTFPYPDFPILRQTPGVSGRWKDYIFIINKDLAECDYWVVLYSLPTIEAATCSPQNTIFFTGEPSSIQSYNQNFLEQFAHVVTCQREINHPQVTYLHQGHPWFVGKTYDELLNLKTINKTKLISIITSDKQFTDGHKRRFEFAMSLKDYFGERLDLFGRGINNFEDKWDVLSPYKYSIAIENYVCDDWLTEKLYDCYLSHTFPFYYGCSNIERYFEKESFLTIDINDLNKSKRIIENAINDDLHYEKHLKYVIEAKLRYLGYYNFFPLAVNLIESTMESPDIKKQKIELQPE